jgi:hypothetical protein
MILKQTIKTKIIKDSPRVINELKKSYQHRTHFVTDEIGNLLADSHIILSRRITCVSY